MEAIFKADKHDESGGFVATFPAFSNEELVRCASCEFHYIDDEEEPEYDMCSRLYNKYGENLRIFDLRFHCGYGVRKDNV